MSFGVRMTRLLRRFGHASQRSGRLIAGLGELDSEELDFIVEMEGLVRRGARLTADQARRAAELLSRITTQYRVRMLVSESHNAFTVPQLQEIFQRETRHLAERPSVTAWIRGLAEASEAYGILRWLCGTNFRAQADLTQGLGTRLMSVFSIPAPRHMVQSPEEALAQLLQLPGAPEALFDRIARSLLVPSHRSAGAMLLASGQISRGLFSILKGNVAELLARNEIMAVLRRGEHFGSMPEGAVLVTGVRLRRPGGRRSMLFSDGLIGVVDGERWRWIAAVEVKSYDAGFADGVAQVTRWRDVSALESGFTLEFNRGATMTRIADGAVDPVTSPLRFAFDPAVGPDLNRVTIEGERVRHIVVSPRGSSRFDLSRLAGSVPDGVIQIAHPVRTDAIDYMAAVVLQTVAGHSSRERALAALQALTSR